MQIDQIERASFQFRYGWRQRQKFGLRQDGRLPPLSDTDAFTAREMAMDAWRLGYGFGHDRELYDATMFAIEAARLEFTAINGPQPKRAVLKKMLRERDGDDCCVCRQPLGEDATFEHKVALANGGTWAAANLALAHRECNHALGRLPLHAKEAAIAAIQRNKQAKPDA